MTTATRSPLATFDRWMTRLITAVGRAIGALVVMIVVVILFDVVTRGSLFVGSTELQELEWHLHTAVLMLALAYAYLSDAHVRIGLVRDRLSPRTRAFLEAAGVVLFLVPFCLVSIHYGIDFAATSFVQGESSPSPAGLGQRWIVKSTLPLGMFLLLIAGCLVLVRSVRIVVLGPENAPPMFGEPEHPAP